VTLLDDDDDNVNKVLKYFFGTSAFAHGVKSDGQINAPFL